MSFFWITFTIIGSESALKLMRDSRTEIGFLKGWWLWIFTAGFFMFKNIEKILGQLFYGLN